MNATGAICHTNVCSFCFAGAVSNQSSSRILQSTGHQRRARIRKHSDSSVGGRKQCGQRRVRRRGRSNRRRRWRRRRRRGAADQISICSALKRWRRQQRADRAGRGAHSSSRWMAVRACWPWWSIVGCRNVHGLAPGGHVQRRRRSEGQLHGEASKPPKHMHGVRRWLVKPVP